MTKELYTTLPFEDIEEVEELDQSSIDELIEVLQFELMEDQQDDINL